MFHKKNPPSARGRRRDLRGDREKIQHKRAFRHKRTPEGGDDDWVAATAFRENSEKGGSPAAGSPTATLLRLHPSHETYLGERPPRRVELPASGIPRFHGVTGGVYKTRERIHRGMLIRDY